jgi:hypothetical protein
MNDEKRPQPLMTDRLLGEERLARLYQETTTEMPPPGLDAAILDAARQATRQKPRRVFFLASRKWTVPLSLAAALVMTIGVVRSLRHQMESPVTVAPAPVAPRLSSAARVDARDETVLKQREQKQGQTQEAPVVAQSLRETLGKTTVPATQLSLPAAGSAQSAPAERHELRDDAELQRQELVQPEKEQDVASALHAPGATTQSAPERRGKMKAEGAKKDALSLGEWSPDEWIAEIKKLRHAGKKVEAEASLKAFTQRYPTYPIEQALALPPPSPNAQRGAQ